MYMKKILLVFLVINGMFISCKKDCKPGIPECIQQRIEEIKKQPKWNPPAEINEYSYNGQTVYLVSADCCDQYDVLLDSKCNKICSPGGGIGGNGDGKCEDFYKKATNKKLIWKDDR